MGGGDSIEKKVHLYVGCGTRFESAHFTNIILLYASMIILLYDVEPGNHYVYHSCISYYLLQCTSRKVVV